MYPILETERLLLRPMGKSDFDTMFAMRSNKEWCATMLARPAQAKSDAYRIEFTHGLQNGTFFTVWLREQDDFIGFVEVDKYWRGSKNAKVIDYAGLYCMLLPEYWGSGLEIEALTKAIHFAFMGLNVNWLFAGHLVANPAPAMVITQLGLSHHSRCGGKNNPHEQYRYTRADYLKNNALADECVYDYNIKQSPYGHDNPIRVIDEIKIPENVDVGLCGQSVIAMLTGLSIAEVAAVMHVGTPGQEVHPSYMEYTLDYYGIKRKGSWGKRIAINKDTVLPDTCILLMNAPEGWNYFSLYHKGKYFDLRVGIVEKLPDSIKPISYVWEIYN